MATNSYVPSIFIKKCHILPYVVMLFYFYKCLEASHDNPDEEDFLLCRQCGFEITTAEHFTPVPSTLAIRQRNDTILGEKNVLIQLFENPQGNKFEVITTKKAAVYKYEKAFAEHSWFPGFLWRICVCPRCGAHIGWSFETEDHKDGTVDSGKSFIGLILSSLLHKDFADSLLITPKSYYS